MEALQTPTPWEVVRSNPKQGTGEAGAGDHTSQSCEPHGTAHVPLTSVPPAPRQWQLHSRTLWSPRSSAQPRGPGRGEALPGGGPAGGSGRGHRSPPPGALRQSIPAGWLGPLVVAAAGQVQEEGGLTAPRAPGAHTHTVGARPKETPSAPRSSTVAAQSSQLRLCSGLCRGCSQPGRPGGQTLRAMSPGPIYRSGVGWGCQQSDGGSAWPGRGQPLCSCQDPAPEARAKSALGTGQAHPYFLSSP